MATSGLPVSSTTVSPTAEVSKSEVVSGSYYYIFFIA